MSKEFTKADLKPFMLVVTRDDIKYIVTDNIIETPFLGIKHAFDEYTDDLRKINGDTDDDIMAVYPKPESGRCLSLDLSYRGEPVWVRKEAKKMTLREVCDKLGEEIELIPEEE